MLKLFLKPVFLYFAFLSVNVSAQENNPLQVDFRTDLFSRHLWRGDQLGDAPVIEPEITLSKGNFGLSIWGATTFNNSYSEIDLILNYNILPYLNIAFMIISTLCPILKTISGVTQAVRCAIHLN